MPRYRRGFEPEEPSLSADERERLDEVFASINRDQHREPTRPVLRTATGHPVEPRWFRELCHRDER